MAKHYNGISANYSIKPKEAFPQESINEFIIQWSIEYYEYYS